MIQYSAIARNNVILVSHQRGAGHLENVAESMLVNVPTHGQLRVTYTSDNFLFHVRVEEGLTYLCAGEPSFGRAVPHAYLEEIRRRFNQTTLASRAISARSHELDRDFEHIMSQEMEKYSSGQKGDQLSHLKSQVEEVKGVMTENIERVLQRGDKLEDLMDRTTDLEASAIMFKSTAKRVRRKMWWKNTKMMIIIFFVVALILTLIILFATGTIPTS